MGVCREKCRDMHFRDWNLDLRATDRYGETYSQTLLQGFRSVRANMDVSLTKDLGKFEVVSGDYFQ